MFIEPQPTPYDWRFHCFGFPVRVTPWFWLAACVLGYEVGTSMPRLLMALAREETPAFSEGVGVVLWIIAVFVSILVHELGHTFAMRYYGMDASIVLYHMGGLAIPGAATRWDRPVTRINPQRQVVISAAGPIAQLLLALVVYLGLRLTGHFSATFTILDPLLPAPQGPLLASRPLHAMAIFILLPSIHWALLNLLPVYPLDGGQIARSLLTLRDPWQGVTHSLWLSVGTCAVVALWGLQNQQPFLGVMFLMLGFGSWQQLQARGGAGRGPW